MPRKHGLRVWNTILTRRSLRLGTFLTVGAALLVLAVGFGLGTTQVAAQVCRPGTACGTPTKAPVIPPTPTPCTVAAENVVWSRFTPNTGVTGNSIMKVSGGVAWGNAGAVSTRAILSGDGYVESTAVSRTYHTIFGLGNGDTNADYTDIDFAIHLQGTIDGHPGDLKIFENGVEKQTFGPTYVAGDVFRVAIRSNKVSYYKNGQLLY